MAKSTIGDLEGGAALCAWFEGVPHSTTLNCVSWSFGKARRVVWSPIPSGWNPS